MLSLGDSWNGGLNCHQDILSFSSSAPVFFPECGLHSLHQWFSARDGEGFRPPFPGAFGDIWGEGGIQWVEVTDATKHTAMYETAPKIKSYLTPNVNNS